MARIISSPKPRATVPALTPPASAAPLVTGSPPAAPAPEASDPVEAAVAQAAERSLLRRSLGRAGTVLTGWRGVLTPGSLAPRRKTLLGG
ncbi:hypothetical protein [Indioceanicola profundi]|uniref:hypothetical protein n=1 Tax=Indioceanicola profundi TaxID=2220096 RepID=UPI000E6AC884|nr:hypothetical protein [Indioceanicola profundi]